MGTKLYVAIAIKKSNRLLFFCYINIDILKKYYYYYYYYSMQRV